MVRCLLLLLLAFNFLSSAVYAFLAAALLRTNGVVPSHLAAAKTTLTDETLWNLRFVLRGVSTEKGKKVDEIFSITAKFLEEEGYEPPQGSLKQTTQDESRLKIIKGRWKLSEDPNDRKDGLWVWGLFEEPLYPFMLLQMQTESIPLAAGSEDSIKPLQLYAQINHKRDSEIGVILEGADLKVRQMETVEADLFGIARVDIYEELSVGTLSSQPVAPKVATS